MDSPAVLDGRLLGSMRRETATYSHTSADQHSESVTNPYTNHYKHSDTHAYDNAAADAHTHDTTGADAHAHNNTGAYVHTHDNTGADAHTHNNTGAGYLPHRGPRRRIHRRG